VAHSGRRGRLRSREPSGAARDRDSQSAVVAIAIVDPTSGYNERGATIAVVRIVGCERDRRVAGAIDGRDNVLDRRASRAQQARCADR
jgi:hypothetical protein